jgi:hypothetical protein
LEMTEDRFPSVDTGENNLELYTDSQFPVKYSYRDHKCSIVSALTGICLIAQTQVEATLLH